MKFVLLPVGECFEYQNERYSKTGPLTAANLDNNHQRMIPRSALVKPVATANRDVAQPASSLPDSIDTQTVIDAMAEYHQASLDALQRNSNNPEEQQRSLEEARQRFLERCGIA